MKKRYRPSKERTRMFKGIPIEEAQASIHVQPNARDIEGATKEDPRNCMYARCLRRVLDAPNVFVFKQTAYIQNLNEKGQPVMRRYKVKKYARETLIKFDSGQKVQPGGFVFHRPNKSETLEYKYRQGLKRKKKSPRTTVGNKPRMKSYELRKGTGCVHLFSANEDQITPRRAA